MLTSLTRSIPTSLLSKKVLMVTLRETNLPIFIRPEVDNPNEPLWNFVLVVWSPLLILLLAIVAFVVEVKY
jgi:hypothetical protein